MTPTVSEEGPADEEPAPKPELASAEPEWEMTIAADNDVKRFPIWYPSTAWSCDVLFTILRTDISKSSEIMLEWSNYMEMHYVPDDQQSASRSIRSCLMISTFASAYQTVVGQEIATFKTHEHFAATFVQKKKG